MPTIEDHQPRLHWQERGAGAPLLLVMGHRFSGAMWGPLVDLLATQYRVIWFDNRGTGSSGSTRDAAMSDLAGDAFAVMDAAGVTSAHVFGVSMGGWIAQEMAMTHPERVRSLVIGCSSALTADKPRGTKLRYLNYYLPHRLTVRLAPTLLYGPACPPERKTADTALLAIDVSDTRGVVAQFKAIRNYSVRLGQVADIQQPVLILHGTKDKVLPFAGATELDTTLPHSHLVPYEGSGHNFAAEFPDRVAADALNFLHGLDQKDGTVDDGGDRASLSR